MAKYTSDTNLIRGAATAYKNYDNMPGMYAGLDKITEAGMGMVGEAVKGFEAEKKKQEEETKAAEAEKKRQDNNWYDISGAVYENAGSFMKDVEYKDTVSQLTALKPRLIAARKSGNPEEIAAVMTEFNNIKSDVDGHKAFRETITNPEYGISNAMKHSGIKPGDNGEDHNFLTGLVGGDMMFNFSKGDMIVRLQNILGVSEEETLVCGDGANDLSMFAHAGTRVAFCARPILEKEANIIIKEKNLMKILEKI